MSDDLNIVILRGTLSRPAELRLLPTGSSITSFEVTTRRGDPKADTAPVVWYDAPTSAGHLDGGDEVVVVGHVTRRFFRSGGVTQSRTEVVAETVVSARSAKRVEAALIQAVALVPINIPNNT